MKKTYVTFDKRSRVCLVRIGKSLVKIEFDDKGEYTSENKIFQQAIENTYAFSSQTIQLKSIEP